MEGGEKFTIWDLEELLREEFRRHRSHPSTMMARVDGFYEDGESDTDDGTELAEGDAVRWNWFKTNIGHGALPDRPYINGVVLHTNPQERGFDPGDLPNHVYVRLSHGPGAWFERQYLKKVSAPKDAAEQEEQHR